MLELIHPTSEHLQTSGSSDATVPLIFIRHLFYAELSTYQLSDLRHERPPPWLPAGNSLCRTGSRGGQCSDVNAERVQHARGGP